MVTWFLFGGGTHAWATRMDFNPGFEFVERVWDQKSGATSNRINDVIESDQGFLWLATYEGIVRYDGVNGRLFSERDHPGLLGGAALLSESKPGHIWSLSSGGVLIRIVDGTIKAWEIADKIADPDSVRLDRDWNQQVVILSSSGIFTVNAEDEVVPYALPEVLEGLEFRTLLFDQERSILWMAESDGSLWQLREDGVEHYALPELGSPGERIYSIYANPDGTLWLGIAGYLAHFDPKSGELEVLPESSYHLPNRRVRFARKRNPGEQVLLGTISSPVYAIRGREVVEVHTGSPEMERVIAMTELKHGGFALATYNRGLVMLQPSRVRSFHGGNGFIDEMVNAIDVASKGGWWIGTASGSYHFDGEHFRLIQRKWDDVTTYSVDLMEDSRGRLWIATLGEGVWMLDGERWSQISVEHGLFSSSIRAFAEDREGNIWIGTAAGVHCWNDGILRSVGVAQGLENPYVISLHVDAMEQVWISTNAGLYRFSGDRAVKINGEGDAAVSYSSRTFFSVGKDSFPGSVGGMSGGVLRVVGQQAWFLDLYNVLGIASVFHVIDDGMGHHWLTSSRGMFRVKSEELQLSLQTGVPSFSEVLHVDSRDGLPSDAIRSISRFHQDGPRMWIPAERGFFLLDASVFEVSQYVPTTWIDEVELNGTKLSGGFPRQQGSGIFDAGLRRLQFRFTAPYFGDPGSVSYETKLVGFEDVWRHTNLREVTYTNLSPGEYRFEVRAISRAGSMDERGTASFAFTVAPYFHETIWFYLTLGSVLVLLVFAVFFSRLHFLRQGQVRLERIVEDRTCEIEAQKLELAASNARLQQLVQLNKEFMGIAAHDLRNPTAAVISLVELLNEELKGRGVFDLRDYTEGIRISANNMSFLIRNLLDVNRLDEGKAIARLTPVNVAEVIAEVMGLSAESAERKRIQLDCHEGEFEGVEVIADRGFLAQVLDNFVSNAVKYSNTGSVVTVGCKVHAGKVRIEVRDEGPGLTRDDKEHLFEKFARLSAKPTGGEPSSGLGLSIAKRLTELMSGNIGCESERGRGSVFWVQFPRS